MQVDDKNPVVENYELRIIKYKNGNWSYDFGPLIGFPIIEVPCANGTSASKLLERKFKELNKRNPITPDPTELFEEDFQVVSIENNSEIYDILQKLKPYLRSSVDNTTLSKELMKSAFRTQKIDAAIQDLRKRRL
jgi:hypothetical protein